MIYLDFTGKTVLVVGGSSGIGNGIAQAFRRCGAAVHVTGTRPSVSHYSDQDGSDLTGLAYSTLGVSNPNDIERDAPKLPSLDILVLSQGHVRYRRQEFEREGWEQVIAVNLSSLMHIARRYHPALARSKGSLLIISSVSGFMSNKGNPAYSASKAGAVSLTATLGEAWAGDGIRVNGIAPGFVETKMTAVTLSDPMRREATLAAIPLKRLGMPAEMAGAALFLASPLASYIIGQTLIVDGGLTLS